MAKYCYSQLSLPTNIRLLRLLPSERDIESLQGELFEYRLQNSNKPSHPYEALSYVWGGDEKPQSISMGNQNLDITQNLYTALQHLRDHDCSRILWVDAICINQENNEEKGDQIVLMAEIYAKALRVVVWLGGAETDSDQALEVIRLAGEKSAGLSNTEPSQKAVRQLLKRPWFQRIWVLQEIAAAQHVQIICGSTEIDGHAFCLGLDFLGTVIEGVSAQVTFLIRGAIFRSGNISRKHGRLSLEICSLGELLDMYRAHRATKPHDMVYALLGMCSDDLSAAGLRPDYSLEWKVLMQRVFKFLLSDHVSVEAWSEKKRAVVKSKGYVIGKVRARAISNDTGGRQNVEAIIATSPGCTISGSARWLMPTSVKSIQEGDLICLLQGALKPTIVRLQHGYFTIIVIVATLPEHISTEGGAVRWSDFAQSAVFIRDFTLVWDWETSIEDIRDHGQQDALPLSNELQLQYAKTKSENEMENAIRAWNAAQILGDLGEFLEADKKKQKAEECFQAMLRKRHTHSLECHCNHVPLLWAAENGENAVINMLIVKHGVDLNLKDYYERTPLHWAAANGHEAVVKLLLNTGKVDVDAKDKKGQTLSYWPVVKRYEAVVKVLLHRGKVILDVDAKAKNGWTPLYWAAVNGHKAVVKLLLDTGKVDVDTKAENGWTPLHWAAIDGHEAIVKLLLDTDKVDINAKDKNGQTPLLWAIRLRHEAIVKLLLNTDKVDIDAKDKSYWTPLLSVVDKGYEITIKLLLDTDKVDVDVKDEFDQTPLLYTAKNGYEAIVKLLLDTGKVDANVRDKWGWTPLLYAAKNGHEAVVKLLLDTGKVDADVRDREGWTPLLYAAKNGHEAVVKLLLNMGKVNANARDKEGWTPLGWAAENGHEAVVKMLQLLKGYPEIRIDEC